MKLQIALDDIEMERALALVEEVREYIDIIEMGTPFIYQEGIRAVSVFKEAFPEKEILADMKIMDAGYYEAEQALKAGADYVTFLAVTDKGTAKACVQAADKYGKEAVADMICVEDIPKCVKELEELGVHGIAVHTGVDQQAAGRTPLGDLEILKKHCKTAKISVAGGINEKTIASYAQLQPDIVIVGSGLCHAENPKEMAKIIKEGMLC